MSTQITWRAAAWLVFGAAILGLLPGNALRGWRRWSVCGLVTAVEVVVLLALVAFICLVLPRLPSY